jgi:AmmeMemoRadiSam system protein A
MDPPATDAASIADQLGDAGQRSLAGLAWEAVRCAVQRREIDPSLLSRAPQTVLFGAFVTLTSGGKLRGCIGSVGRPRPAAELVASAGRSAAVADSRFSPVSPGELPTLELDVSLLTPLEWLAPDQLPAVVQVGRHGLIVERPPWRGLLLPQVASEWGFDAETFLAETCRKAGLPRDAWRSDARVGRFEALVVRGGRAPTS